jgi:hypothetical protein
LQPLGARNLPEFYGKVFQQLADGKGRDIRLDYARVELRNIHQRAE